MYSLHCSVCDSSFCRRKEWLHHLLQYKHQNKARLQILEWGEQVKQCVLVMYSNVQIPTGCEALLQHFLEVNKSIEMEDGGGEGIFVADFVWFPTRRGVGFLQFESRSKVEQVMADMCDPELHLRMWTHIRLRKAMDFPISEWYQLFPTCPREPDVHVIVEHPCTRSSKTPPELIVLVDDDDNDESNEQLRRDQLHAQFQAIEKRMLIPADRLSAANSMTTRVKEVVFSAYPKCEAHMFHNYYLQLRNRIEPDFRMKLLVFVHLVGHHSKKRDRGSAKEPLAILTVADKKILEGVLNSKKTGFEFHHKQSGLDVFLTKSCKVLPQVQSCRLLVYLCTFDKRVKPMLMLIRYWASINNVRTSDAKRDLYDPPDFSELDWLVIFFLVNKKIIPTPRQAQVASHDTLNFEGVDIGFSENPEFGQMWTEMCGGKTTSSGYRLKDDFVFGVLSLTRKFFKFYERKLCFDDVILNTRDGELIERNKFIEYGVESSTRTLRRISKLSEAELEFLQKQMNKSRTRGIYFLHPLHLGYSFPFIPDKTWKESKRIALKTGGQLQDFLEKYETGSVKMDSNNLRNALQDAEQSGILII